MTDLGFRRSLLYAAKRITVEWFERVGKPPVIKNGTGFIVRHRPSGDRPEIICLVTNRHLVDPTYADPKYIDMVSLSRVTLTAIETCAKHGEHRDVITLSRPDAWVYPDGYDDVAALVLQETVDLPTLDGCPTFNWSTFNSTLLAPAAAFVDRHPSRSIEPGDLVAVSGYPEIQDEQQTRPVALFGYISSDPAHSPEPPLRADGRSLRSDRVVLYQGFSRSGASGSLIIALRRGMPTDFLEGHDFNVMGKMMGHQDFNPRPVQLVGINGGHVRSTTDDPSALSYFIRSDAILEAIKKAALV